MYIRKGPDNHGYIQPGVERFDGISPELRHAFNICTLNVANLPEESLPGFKEDMSEIVRDFKSLSALLLQALAIGLGAPSTNHSFNVHLLIFRFRYMFNQN